MSGRPDLIAELQQRLLNQEHWVDFDVPHALEGHPLSGDKELRSLPGNGAL